MKRFSLAAIYFTMAICFGFTVTERWMGDHNCMEWKGTIGSDGYGYYSYLPCVFIYHKFDYKRVLEEASKVRPGSAYNATAIVFQNKEVDKCFPGVAILLAPFFLIAYALSYLLGFDTGGYGFLFQASVSIAALFYLTLGLVFLRKLMKEFSISDKIIGVTLILVVLGTNLFYYATREPSMGHVYSFGLTAVFLFYVKKSIQDFRLRNLVWMTVAISILVLVRPTNLLSLFFVPFLAGNWKNTSGFILNFFKSKKIFLLLLIPSGMLCVEFLLWYLQTGHFFVWSYPGEGFNFKQSHFLDILFSYKKGWFTYTSLMFVALVGGLTILYRQNRFQFWDVLFFFIIITYILSSWSSWSYGGSFGLRAYLDFYPAFAILLALFLNSLTSQRLKVSFMVLTFLCMGFNLIQTYQYFNCIIPYEGMNKEEYWKVFLKMDPSFGYIFYYPDTSNYKCINNYSLKNDFEHNTGGNDQTISTTYAHSGTHAAFVNEKQQVSPVLSLKASILPPISPLSINVKLWAYMPSFNNNASIVISLQTEKGECYLWSVRNLQGFVFDRNVWTQAYSFIELPAFKNPSDILKVFVFDTKGAVYIDDMEVTFGTQK